MANDLHEVSIYFIAAMSESLAVEVARHMQRGTTAIPPHVRTLADAETYLRNFPTHGFQIYEVEGRTVPTQDGAIILVEIAGKPETQYQTILRVPDLADADRVHNGRQLPRSFKHELDEIESIKANRHPIITTQQAAKAFSLTTEDMSIKTCREIAHKAAFTAYATCDRVCAATADRCICRATAARIADSVLQAVGFDARG